MTGENIFILKKNYFNAIVKGKISTRRDESKYMTTAWFNRRKLN